MLYLFIDVCIRTHKNPYGMEAWWQGSKVAWLHASDCIRMHWQPFGFLWNTLECIRSHHQPASPAQASAPAS